MPAGPHGACHTFSAHSVHPITSLSPPYHLTQSTLPPHSVHPTTSLSPPYHLTQSTLPPHSVHPTTSLSPPYNLTQSTLPPHSVHPTTSLSPPYHLTSPIISVKGNTVNVAVISNNAKGSSIIIIIFTSVQTVHFF